MTPQDPTIPYGLCHCGCGQQTKIADKNLRKEGWVKGKPLRFIYGHVRSKTRATTYFVDMDGYVVACIPLTLGQYAIVDMWKFISIEASKWYACMQSKNGKFKAQRRPRGRRSEMVLMAREILDMSPEDRRLVDHENGNPLDNRMCNLRFANKAKNGQNRGKPSNNTSGYKGVSWNARKSKWFAQITANKVHYFLGYFNSKEEAYAAYCEAAYRLHGEFARVA